MILSGCGLDGAGVGQQVDRYRRIGQGARIISRTNRVLVTELAPDIDAALIDQAIETERGCCQFFELSWHPEQRRLTVGVSDTEHEPALGAIASALGV